MQLFVNEKLQMIMYCLTIYVRKMFRKISCCIFFLILYGFIFGAIYYKFIIVPWKNWSK